MKTKYKNHLLNLIFYFAAAILGGLSITLADDNTATYIGINKSSNTTLDFRFGEGPTGLTDKLTDLEAGSYFQLPPEIAIYSPDSTGNPKLNLSATLESWTQKSYQDPKFFHYRPRFKCPENLMRCSNPQPYFPVMLQKETGKKTLGSDKGPVYGYLPLEDLLSENKKGSYHVIQSQFEPSKTEESPAKNNYIPQASDEGSTGSETTSNQASSAPQAAEPPPHSELNCESDNFGWRESGYQTNNCLYKLDILTRAHIIADSVSKINQIRGIHVDPRFSVCIAWRESEFAPNAQGGAPDWGLFQVINSTARGTLNQFRPVTPGFTHYTKGSHWEQYKEAMRGNILAQADLHHSVVVGMARWKRRDRQLRSGTMSSSDYRYMAETYNGGADKNIRNNPSVRRYGRAIKNCFDKLKQASGSSGHFNNVSKANLKKALCIAAPRSCKSLEEQ